MNDLELIRDVLPNTDAGRNAELRKRLAAQTWDHRESVLTDGPVNVVTADSRPVEVVLQSVPQGPYRDRPKRRAPMIAIAAAAAVVLLITGLSQVRARSTSDLASAALDASPSDVASIQAAAPQLLTNDLRLRWPPIAWEATPEAKEVFRVTETEKMRQTVESTYAAAVQPEHQSLAQVSLERALRMPQPFVDRAEIRVEQIDDIRIVGSEATATVRYSERLHVTSDPHAPNQVFSFVTDAQGWNSNIQRSTIHLVREDGAWKLALNVSQLPGG